MTTTESTTPNCDACHLKGHGLATSWNATNLYAVNSTLPPLSDPVLSKLSFSINPSTCFDRTSFSIVKRQTSVPQAGSVDIFVFNIKTERSLFFFLCVCEYTCPSELSLPRGTLPWQLSKRSPGSRCTYAPPPPPTIKGLAASFLSFLPDDGRTYVFKSENKRSFASVDYDMFSFLFLFVLTSIFFSTLCALFLLLLSSASTG